MRLRFDKQMVPDGAEMAQREARRDQTLGSFHDPNQLPNSQPHPVLTYSSIYLPMWYYCDHHLRVRRFSQQHLSISAPLPGPDCREI